MSSGKGLTEFPEVEAKLQKPTKQSVFERQKAEAEAKRQREEAETAAVYEDFVRSFDQDSDHDYAMPQPPRGRPAFGGPPSGPGTSKRHFGTSGLRSGPGSLGPPPSSFGKKRSFQDFSRPPREKGTLGFEEEGKGSALTVGKAFNTSDDEDMGDATNRAEEKAIAKPTLRLSNMPPGTSPALIKALIPGTLVVENVKIVPPVGPGGTERKSTVAIVTMSQDTPANEMDAVVNQLQNRYLGYGYYLSLHRHLSSAVVTSTALPNLASSSSAPQPFGAKPVEQPSGQSDRSSHQGFHRSFAPPSSYSQGGGNVNRANLLYIPVKAPQDVKTIQLINKVIEGVLQHGAEFEALLMSRPEVQREEKWAWIWDARSQGGVWYRWRLWEVVTGSESSRKKGKYVPLFDGSHAWKTPDKSLIFEYTTRLDEFVSDPEYNSSDDEDFEVDKRDKRDKRDNHDGELEKTFLNPLDKAKLTHLLARLPRTLARLRVGDIARITAFAITHASRGVDEVVDMIVTNVDTPFSTTGANPERKQETKEPLQGSGQDEGPAAEGAADISAASLVGLYVVSDVLSSSATSGVRHAWRFRQLFETALKGRKTFETLGLMPEKLKWGRMKAEKWKRSITLVLNLWESWCVFPNESHELFVKCFENPPSLNPDEKADEAGKTGNWKTVESNASVEQDRRLPMSTKEEEEEEEEEEENYDDGEPIDDEDVAGEPIVEDDVEGEPLDEEDVEGEPIEDDDIHGEPIEDDGEPMDEDEASSKDMPEPTSEKVASRPQETSQARGPRKRMRAVDMFADSDDSDKNN